MYVIYMYNLNSRLVQVFIVGIVGRILIVDLGLDFLLLVLHGDQFFAKVIAEGHQQHILLFQVAHHVTQAFFLHARYVSYAIPVVDDWSTIFGQYGCG